MWQFIGAKQVKWFPKGEDARGRMRFGRLRSPVMRATVKNGPVTIHVGRRADGTFTVKWPDVEAEYGMGGDVYRPAARGPVETFYDRGVFTRRLSAIGFAPSTVGQVLGAIGA